MSQFKYSVIAISHVGNMFKSKTIDFTSNSADFSTSLFALVEQNKDTLKHSYFITTDDNSPVTFDYTLTWRSHIDTPVKSDQFACTFAAMETLISDQENRENFISISSPFCRIIRSKTGDAGAFFCMHDRKFAAQRKDPKAPFYSPSIFLDESKHIA